MKKTGDACGSRCCRLVKLLKLGTGEEKGGGERQRGPCQMQQDRFASEWAWLLIGFISALYLKDDDVLQALWW